MSSLEIEQRARQQAQPEPRAEERGRAWARRAAKPRGTIEWRMLAPLLALCTLVCVTLLLIAEHRARTGSALLFKLGASLCFVLLALSGLGARPTPFDRLLVVGLACAALGDVLLALPGQRAFQAGVAAFFCGHVAYVAAARSALGAGALPTWAWLVGLASLAAYLWLHRYLGVMRVPVAAYLGVITLMVVYAIALYVAQPTTALPFLLGALLFYVSDLSVARDRFVQSALINRVWGLPAYYAGQLLIAHSVTLL